MVDDISDRIQTLLDREDVFMVNGLEVARGFPGREQIG